MRKVLVIDDEPSYRDALELMLAHEGFQVATARNGREAIRHVEADPPDVLVVDWLLRGEMDGLAVLRAVRELVPAVHAVFITGYPTPSLRASVARLPSTVFLAKPFDLVDLIAAVRNDGQHSS